MLAQIDSAELKRTEPAAKKDVSASAASPRLLVSRGRPPLIGIYTVGVGGNFTSLTNPGGAFDVLNQNGGAGDIAFNIISDLTAETGVVALGTVGNSPNIRIRPSGASRMVSGSNNTSLIRFNDTDNVTIEGSVTDGTASGVGGDPALRNLTLQNTSSAATNGAVVAVTEGTAGAQNFTIRNTNVSGQAFDQTLIALHIGGNVIGIGPSVSNNNARVENCSFQKAGVGILNFGHGASPARGCVITMNDLSAAGANRLRHFGIFFYHQNGIQVTANNVGNMAADGPFGCIGIAAGCYSVEATNEGSANISNALIAGNRIHSIVNTHPEGASAAGIALSGGNPANIIANNMITGVSASSISPELSVGIFIGGWFGSETRLYYNSVAMTGDRGAAPNQSGSYCVAITGALPTVDLRGNIFYNTQTSGGGVNAKSYVLGTRAAVAGLRYVTSDHNALTSGGSNDVAFRTGGVDATGTDFATLAAWQAATGKDVHSMVDDPEFISPLGDLHLTCESSVRNAGIPVAGVPNDYDGQTRDAFHPDIGADEVVGPTASVGSLKVHGDFGSFVLGLPSGTPAIESRSGGVNGDFSVVFSFPSPVTISGASVSGGVLGSVSSVTGEGTPDITVHLTGVADAQYVTVRLSCVDDGVQIGDVDTTFGVLLGDTNGNGSVSATDVGQAKSRSGQSADPSNFRADVNASGTINASDIGQVKSASGSALP